MKKFVSIKALGDFVILAHVIKILKKNNISDVRIIAAYYLRDLAIVLGVEKYCDFIDVPVGVRISSFFDIRNSSFFRAIMDLFIVRQTIKRNMTDVTNVIFDRFGIRELVLGGGKSSFLSFLPMNIYEAYYSYIYKSHGLSCQSFSFELNKLVDGLFVILPSAGSVNRAFPRDLLSDVYNIIIAGGFKCKIYLQKDDPLVHVYKGLPLNILTTGFSELSAAVCESDFIISADSLGMHLANFYSKPCYVFAPNLSWTKLWLPPLTRKYSMMSDFNGVRDFSNFFGDNFL